MGRKSRHSIKSGDKAIKKQSITTSKTSKYDDNIYNEVDQYHLEKEDEQEQFISLNQDDDSDESDNGLGGVEGVMDLGVHDDDSDDSNDSNDSESESEDEKSKSDDESQNNYDSSSSEEEIDNRTKILNWGKRKKDYYHGDTADLEIGQDFDDAEVEEEAGREIQQMRFERMDDDDFMPFQDTKKKQIEEPIQMTKHRQTKIQKLDPHQKQRILETEHPEFFPVVSYFTDRFVMELKHKVSMVANQLLMDTKQAETIGCNRQGLEYLHHKRLLLMSTTLNLCTYLLFKCDAIKKENSHDTNEFMDDSNTLNDMKNHPLIFHLNKLSTLADQIETKMEKPLGLIHQFQSLVQAIQLMEQENNTILSDNEISKDEDIDSDSQHDENQEQTMIEIKNTRVSSSSDDDTDNEEIEEHHLLNDARFGIRSQDIESKSKKQRRRAPISSSDYGDDDDMVDDETRRNASKKLASTMNTIAQKSKKNKHKSTADGIDDIMEREIGTGVARGDYIDDDEINRGLKMMENDIGPASDDDYDNELEDDLEDEGDALYELMKKKSKTKKQKRKQIYAVAPKYPRLDTDVEGERAIGQMIMKNRGLVAHKNKLNRNPRVKKREQYRKALIRRRGAVREVRTGEAHAYGGEETGVKKGVSRSRKLGVQN